MIDINLSSQWMIALLFGLLLLLAVLLVNFRKQQQAAKMLETTVEMQHQQLGEQSRLLALQTTEHALLGERLSQQAMQCEALQQRLDTREKLIASLQQQLSESQSGIARLETRLTEERKAAAEKLALLDEAKAKLGNEFRLLANQIFEEKGKALSEQSRDTLDAVLKPMREQFRDFRSRVDEIHTDESKERASLKAHLAQLEQLNRQMSEDAINLTHALKGDSKAQGNWGEMILERILESSGLREGHEFVREDSTTIDAHKRLRPDVVIRMPGDKHIIIDSKVSLTDYERVIAANDSETRKKYRKAHVQSIRSHIRGLSDKHYAHLPGIHSPDYVLMFMPVEGAYMMAIETDQGIFEAAFEKGVAVVTPSTLYATLKLIEQLWRAEKQSDNVIRLIDRAGKLHDKMVSFVESFVDIGNRLKQAQDAYDLSLNRMKDGPGNVIRQIDEIGKLAGKTKKEMPASMLGEVDDEPLDKLGDNLK
ncbi:MAG: DNA recombination protein RmuC [Zetaproteobacteria bacterium CG_4_9_14_3_um_filter_49_83]|nr:MAG: recombinase RmuC [Zetaproteobacteria bacterium CG1_02_49_23]PIQ31021.1 MAG: DNA recombination protein RmuC [Zetaproteobacteria bacterium CG17_big_fil_post_rev_8_21_14_2_50_50_13]PIV30950.1 MAG: DNA recombination protein RmuC [Zetaproteobacteria bacterium CG02_land_8_20_14_3_00_50_9]PIY56930.1 MAG: DNA recombination protein RmuC [Zetaproteobacteria bacterium CG_4_10_14_0_8_um_filter_49_80]PJA35845.1 MAG: DNA recombination protein RmuC [Zetaproteobacteria bacterium CG_4_9_14_3_um_filter_4